MKCQIINCNNKKAYCGNNYIEKIGDKLEWNLGYKKNYIMWKKLIANLSIIKFNCK